MPFVIVTDLRVRIVNFYDYALKEYAVLNVTYQSNRILMDELAQVIIEFNEKANQSFFSLYEKFAAAIKPLSRQKDDNVFQQQQGKYLQTLKTELEYLARQLLDKNKIQQNYNLLNKKLTDEISMYLNEFKQKSRSL